MLEPLELAVEKGCYQSKKGRAVASLVAEKLIKEGKPVMMRYIKKIENCYLWAQMMTPLGRRFEAHLDGVGVDRILKCPCPERIFWRHLKWIRDHKDKLSEKNHRQLMKFDRESAVETFADFPASVIAYHLA
jgi:hypothetical protein